MSDNVTRRVKAASKVMGLDDPYVLVNALIKLGITDDSEKSAKTLMTPENLPFQDLCEVLVDTRTVGKAKLRAALPYLYGKKSLKEAEAESQAKQQPEEEPGHENEIRLGYMTLRHDPSRDHVVVEFDGKEVFNLEKVEPEGIKSPRLQIRNVLVDRLKIEILSSNLIWVTGD